MEDEQIILINSTKAQIENFKESILWQDIKRELNFWVEGFDMERDAIIDNAGSDNPSTASVLLHMGDINGRKKAVSYMLEILDVFLSLLEDKNDSKCSGTN